MRMDHIGYFCPWSCREPGEGRPLEVQQTPRNPRGPSSPCLVRHRPPAACGPCPSAKARGTTQNLYSAFQELCQLMGVYQMMWLLTSAQGNILYLLFFSFFKTISFYSPGWSKILAMQPSLVSNSRQPFCLSLLSAGTTGVMAVVAPSMPLSFLPQFLFFPSSFFFFPLPPPPIIPFSQLIYHLTSEPSFKVGIIPTHFMDIETEAGGEPQIANESSQSIPSSMTTCTHSVPWSGLGLAGQKCCLGQSPSPFLGTGRNWGWGVGGGVGCRFEF